MVDECLELKGNCSGCRQEIRRKDLMTHVCPQKHFEVIESQKTEIQNLKQENADQKKIIDSKASQIAKLKE